MNLTTIQLMAVFVAIGTSWLGGCLWTRILVSRYLRDVANHIPETAAALHMSEMADKKNPLAVAAVFLHSAGILVLTVPLWVYIGWEKRERLKKAKKP